ncbi:MAG TPA: XTP/dITP diphosphatase, partial [Thermoplasmatales archaeon]|nr:XTP/dITP diphosphatase [Thermoplasmatales archaeon]
LKSLGVKLQQYKEGYPEIQADTLEEVAFFAVKYLETRFSSPFFLEDAGLFIDALNGFPGVYSAYVFRSIGCEGILKLLEGIDERTAFFKSVIAYKEPGDKPLFFQGVCRGTIAYEKRGNHGFGYDPIFIPEGSIETFGEMEVEVKNSYSHRGRSLQQFIKHIENVIGEKT